MQNPSIIIPYQRTRIADNIPGLRDSKFLLVSFFFSLNKWNGISLPERRIQGHQPQVAWWEVSSKFRKFLILQLFFVYFFAFVFLKITMQNKRCKTAESQRLDEERRRDLGTLRAPFHSIQNTPASSWNLAHPSIIFLAHTTESTIFVQFNTTKET